MTDYTPLIARAVATLHEAPTEERGAVYDRARTALLGHLRGADPPPSEADIRRERVVLETAIRRVEADILLGQSAKVSAAAAALAAGPADEPEAEGEVRRPAAAGRPRVGGAAAAPAPRGRGWRIAIAASAVGLVVAAIAGVAIWTADDPSSYTPPQAAAEPAPAAGPKIAERVSGAEPAPPTEAAVRIPGAAPPAGASLGQRAVLYEETPDNPAVPRAVNGRAVWQLETVPGGQGQPAETAVRIAAEFPQSGMSVGIVLRRNGDAALPASHTMEVRFGFKAGGGPVRDMGLPQFKAEEGIRGAPLLGISVPVTEDYFLVGFSNLPADVERNLDILVNRNWIDIPLRLASGRRAIITIEKGIAGTDAIQAAMARWRT